MKSALSFQDCPLSTIVLEHGTVNEFKAGVNIRLKMRKAVSNHFSVSSSSEENWQVGKRRASGDSTEDGYRVSETCLANSNVVPFFKCLI